MISIIIINFKTKELTKNCIKSILSNCKKDNYEIIVIDNNSSDGSVEYLSDRFKSIKIIKNNKNIGFGGANNIAVKKARGDLLMFLNSDTLLEKDIFSEIINYFDRDKKLGVLSPRLLTSEKEKQIDAYGNYPNLFSVIFRIKKGFKDDDNEFNIEWVSGAAMIVRKNIFEKINGFDNKYFMYFEDMDLCRRIKRLGYGIMVSNKIELIHLGGKSIKKFKKRKKYYYESQDYYFYKWYGFFAMIVIKFFRFPYKIFIYLFR